MGGRRCRAECGGRAEPVVCAEGVSLKGSCSPLTVWSRRRLAAPWGGKAGGGGLRTRPVRGSPQKRAGQPLAARGWRDWGFTASRRGAAGPGGRVPAITSRRPPRSAPLPNHPRDSQDGGARRRCGGEGGSRLRRPHGGEAAKASRAPLGWDKGPGTERFYPPLPPFTLPLLVPRGRRHRRPCPLARGARPPPEVRAAGGEGARRAVSAVGRRGGGGGLCVCVCVFPRRGRGAGAAASLGRRGTGVRPPAAVSAGRGPRGWGAEASAGAAGTFGWAAVGGGGETFSVSTSAPPRRWPGRRSSAPARRVQAGGPEGGGALRADLPCYRGRSCSGRTRPRRVCVFPKSMCNFNMQRALRQLELHRWGSALCPFGSRKPELCAPGSMRRAGSDGKNFVFILVLSWRLHVA